MSQRKHVVMDRSGRVVRVEEMPDDVDPREFLRRALHDCPECRAALARGEVPQLSTEADIAALRASRGPLFPRRPRWREMKRRR